MVLQIRAGPCEATAKVLSHLPSIVLFQTPVSCTHVVMLVRNHRHVSWTATEYAGH